MCIRDSDGLVDPFMSFGGPRAGDYFMLGEGDEQARVLFLTSADPAEGTSICLLYTSLLDEIIQEHDFTAYCKAKAN